MQRKLTAALVAVLAAALAAAATAGAANGKERVLVESFVEAYAFDVDCAEFGDYDFANQVEGTTRVRVTEVFGREGEHLQTVFQIVFQETGTNSATGKSLRLHGAVHEVWDYASNTRTISGSVFIGTDRGRGTYVQDTGRITITLDTREAVAVAGPHEAFFGGGVDIPVCAALATP